MMPSPAIDLPTQEVDDAHTREGFSNHHRPRLPMLWNRRQRRHVASCAAILQSCAVSAETGIVLKTVIVPETPVVPNESIVRGATIVGAVPIGAN